jgi:hypothetical protein
MLRASNNGGEESLAAHRELEWVEPASYSERAHTGNLA